jgi:hypothetical protein
VPNPSAEYPPFPENVAPKPLSFSVKEDVPNTGLSLRGPVPISANAFVPENISIKAIEIARTVLEVLILFNHLDFFDRLKRLEKPSVQIQNKIRLF